MVSASQTRRVRRARSRYVHSQPVPAEDWRVAIAHRHRRIFVSSIADFAIAPQSFPP